MCAAGTMAGSVYETRSKPELYAYWEEQRGKRPAPERADIEPGAIRQVLSDAFILALDGGAGHPFRLAGTRVCALFGRELKGESFIGLWAAASQPIISDLLAILNDERVGTVAGVTAHSADGEPIDLELLLLPLERQPAEPRPHHRHPGAAEGSAMARFVPIGALTLGSRRHLGARWKAACCRVSWRRAAVISSSTRPCYDADGSGRR